MEQELIQENENDVYGVPICGANLSTPVTDVAGYASEYRYQIGQKIFIENAD